MAGKMQFDLPILFQVSGKKNAIYNHDFKKKPLISGSGLRAKMIQLSYSSEVLGAEEKRSKLKLPVIFQCR